MIATRFLWLGLAAALLLGCAGAGDSEPDSGWNYDGDWQPPDRGWDPGDQTNGACSYGYGEDCPEPAVDCASGPCVHGDCVEGSSETSDHCVCETGYAGLRCDACATGYAADGLICVPSTACEDSPCVYGTCRQEAEGFVCDCFVGYAGSLCDACAEGYHAEDLECVPD